MKAKAISRFLGEAMLPKGFIIDNHQSPIAKYPQMKRSQHRCLHGFMPILLNRMN